MHQASPHLDLENVASPTSMLPVPSEVSPVRTRSVKTLQKSSRKVFNVSPRINTLLGVQISATGAYVPERVVTNEELERQYGFEPGWIEQRTGILERRYCAPGQSTCYLSVEAAKRAMHHAGVTPDDIDLLVVGTVTPDYNCPSVACLVQDELGIDAPAFDIQAACSGFIYGLATVSQFVATGNSQVALVIGADAMSRIVDPQDQRIAPLFGDAAGAAIVTPGDPHQGLMCYQLGSDGGGLQMLNRPKGGTLHPLTASDLENGEHFLYMDGRNVFKWAVRVLTDTIDLVLSKTGMSVHDVDLFVLHQANIRIINYAMDQLGIPRDKIYVNLHKYGNTSAASIPLVLDEAREEGRIDRGDTILMSGFGAGLTWGTALFRW